MLCRLEMKMREMRCEGEGGARKGDDAGNQEMVENLVLQWKGKGIKGRGSGGKGVGL